MPLIRPAAARLVATFLPAAMMAATGLWLVRLGGLLLMPLGLVLIGLAAGLALVEWRRWRLGASGAAGPGMVEVSEGILRYWGAGDLGGEIALRDLTEIRLLRINDAPVWRLRSTHEALLVPADATGTEALADAFSALPGIDIGALADARQLAARSGAPMMQVLWRRDGTAPPP